MYQNSTTYSQITSNLGLLHYHAKFKYGALISIKRPELPPS